MRNLMFPGHMLCCIHWTPMAAKSPGRSSDGVRICASLRSFLIRAFCPAAQGVAANRVELGPCHPTSFEQHAELASKVR